MESRNLIVGIDGDLTKSGVGIYNKQTKQISYLTLSFFDLHRWFIENKENIIQVKIEGGWLRKIANFRFTKIQKVSNEISRRVGENHAVGKLIVEMCEDLKINHKISQPLNKKWKGTGGKITHTELENLLKPMGIIISKKSNQENRDAILICLY